MDIKIIMESSKFYRIISDDEYDRLNYGVNNNGVRTTPKSLSLTYGEQESLISLFLEKFTVEESLDTNRFVDNGVIIGFNRVDPDISCWINIRLVRIMPKTKKWPNGRRVDEVEHEICINKLEDEWFLVRGVWPNATSGSEEAMCDQMGGVLRYFRDRFNI